MALYIFKLSHGGDYWSQEKLDVSDTINYLDLMSCVTVGKWH